jgi:TolB-like protein
VRKSGGTLRIAARLIKADNGFIIWSETYDKPVDDLSGARKTSAFRPVM